MQITAAMVKELRERTGAGMMECKKALQAAGGDIDAAIEQMRKSGAAKVEKRAGRVAAEGVVSILANEGGTEAVITEVNSETDFVAKGDDFQGFARAVSASVLRNKPADMAALMEATLPEFGDATVDAVRRELIAKIGENINVRRFTLIQGTGGVLATYLHGTRIGVVVNMEGGDAAVAKDIALHVAASRPMCIQESDIPADVLAKEKEIFAAQAAQSGKPPEIAEKMAAGKLKKFVKEVTLLGQPFVKDLDQSVEKYLAANNARVIRFERLEVGEGIERKAENFAEEVMAQVSAS
ncbi:MAG: translation elongation factor Ts [Gammaproteobacteria bacterium]|nr:translation elongation factor Ts [Gammaproteobacteria bacterium]